MIKENQTEVASRQSERNCHQLFETMTEGFAIDEIICDAAGKPCDLLYLEVNPAFERHTGLKAVNVVGRTAHELFPQAEGFWFERIGKVALTGEPAHFEAWFGPLGRCFEVRSFQTGPGRAATIFFDITERKRTEAELQYKAHALEQICEAVAAFDTNGKLTYWNPAAQRVYGYTEQEAMGRTAEELFQYQWLNGQNLPMCMDALIKTGVWRSENIHKRKSGEEFLAESTTSLLRNERGEITSYLSILRDITERRRTEQAIARHGQRLELLSQTAAHLLLGDDPPAAIQTIFQALKEQVQVDVYFNFLVNESGDGLWLHSFAGIPSEVGRDISHLEFGQAICGTVAANRQPLVCKNIQQSEAPVVQMVKDFGIRAYACNPLLVDGRLLGTLSFGSRTKEAFLDEELELFQTLSRYIALALDRWRLLRETRERADELERRVAERTAQLQESLSSLEGVLYHVAHDLRAPLRAMHSFTELLLENFAPNLDATGEQYAQIISKAAKKMDVLIRDLLDFGRLGHQQVALKAVDLTARVYSLLAGLDRNSNVRKVEIQVEQPLPKVWGNSQIIDQVLENLLSNSLKFVEPGTIPHIRLWAETHDQTVRLYLQDNGIGIAPEHRERIFGVFERLHSDAAYPGTGIGLAIVKKGMERLHGRVGVESKPGEGSRFWLEFKLASDAT
ncbi:MAG: multi-sensor signal transduction histidine kinase [Pedosphaera sp.]|nr:multi-sensor signal transduction histidine kinase [Pedosphaera sp.]